MDKVIVLLLKKSNRYFRSCNEDECNRINTTKRLHYAKLFGYADDPELRRIERVLMGKGKPFQKMVLEIAGELVED
jgi:hypothetical protein